MLRRWFATLKSLPWHFQALKEQLDNVQHQLSVMNLMLDRSERMRLLESQDIANPKRLECFGHKGSSQNDEDRILLENFYRIRTTNKTFREFGSGDGLENNTLYLLCQDWSGMENTYATKVVQRD